MRAPDSCTEPDVGAVTVAPAQFVKGAAPTGTVTCNGRLSVTDRLVTG